MPAIRKKNSDYHLPAANTQFNTKLCKTRGRHLMKRRKPSWLTEGRQGKSLDKDKTRHNQDNGKV